jgi:helicase SWR1
VRKGHAHLDAILDQSGVILETQHVDLSKGGFSRPESPSPSVSEGTTWSSGDESGSDDDANAEDNGDGNISNEDESGDESSRRLLNGHSELSRYRGSQSPSASTGIAEEDFDAMAIADELVQLDLPTHANVTSMLISEEESVDEDASSFRTVCLLPRCSIYG